MITVSRFNFENQLLFATALQIRTTVFVGEQNVDPALEHDKFEEFAQHYLIYFDEKPVGAARWRETSEGIKLERFAVLAKYRNMQVGAQLLKQVVEDVLPFGKQIYLHAQINAVRFYERHGFSVSGESFEEAKIIHYKMILVFFP